MTRVEKYHRYREEIANMKVEDFSSKKIASDKVDKMRKNSTRLGYNDIVSAYEIDGETKSNFKFRLSLDQVLYGIVAIVTIAGLIALIILTK